MREVAIHIAAVVVFLVALVGTAGWIVPILVIAGLEAGAFVISEHGHRHHHD